MNKIMLVTALALAIMGGTIVPLIFAAPWGEPVNAPDPVTNIQVVQMGAGERQFLHFTWDGARDGDVKFKFNSTSHNNYNYYTDQNFLNIPLDMTYSSNKAVETKYYPTERVTYKAKSFHPSYPTYSTEYTDQETITICQMYDRVINNSHC